MNNIFPSQFLYLIPTLSYKTRVVRIWSNAEKKEFTLKLDAEVNDTFKEYVNLYIDSYEPIVDGDWWLSKGRTYVANDNIEWCHKFKYKKIEATTDPHLISKGVKAIDDTYLSVLINSFNGLTLSSDVMISVTKPYVAAEESFNKLLSNLKCKCMRYSPGCFTSNCRNCGFPPESNVIDDSLCVKCGNPKCDCFKKEVITYTDNEVEEIIMQLMHDVHSGDIVYGDNVIDFKLSPRQWFINYKKNKNEN